MELTHPQDRSMLSGMKVIDAQLHEPAITLNWSASDLHTRRQVLTEVLLATMDAVDVDCAVLYPVDLQWAAEVVAKHPHRFAVVPAFAVGGVLRGFTPAGGDSGVDPLSPDADDQIAALAARPGWVGLRLMDVRTMRTPPPGRDAYEQFHRALRTCEVLGVPIFMSTAGALRAPLNLARRYPDVTLIVDHLGIRQPPSFERDTPPFAALPHLLALADQPNIAVKLSGAPTLSERDYPYRDIWPQLRRIVDAFGPDRVMWGSDISRIAGQIGFDVTFPGAADGYAGKHSYAQAIGYLRDCDELTSGEKSWLLFGTAQKVLRWPAVVSP
jgi:L-fuconolactonase